MGLDHAAASRTVARVALGGLVVNVALVALTVTMAALSRSFTLTAMAVDCAVDVVAALVLWLGVRLADRSTPRFPFGLYKIENLIQVGIAVLIFIASYEIAVRAFTTQQTEAEIDAWVIAGVVATIVATWAYGWYAGSRGKRLSSPALIADGRHRQTDVLSTSLGLVAIVSTYAGFDVDRIAAVGILVFATYSGWGLLVGGMKVLLDASVDAATLSRIERALASEALVQQIDDLAVRSAGRYLFLEATLRLRTDDLATAHAATQHLETTIRTALPTVERVNFHLEPRRRDTLHIAAPLASADGEISNEFGEAPHFGLAEVHTADRRIVRQQILPNPHMGAAKQKGILVAEWLVGQGIDVLVTRQAVKKGPSYVLREAGVEVRRAQRSRFDDELALHIGEGT
jgi:cation diffusion facilitator family transporter